MNKSKKFCFVTDVDLHDRNVLFLFIVATLMLSINQVLSYTYHSMSLYGIKLCSINGKQGCFSETSCCPLMLDDLLTRLTKVKVYTSCKVYTQSYYNSIYTVHLCLDFAYVFLPITFRKCVHTFLQALLLKEI